MSRQPVPGEVWTTNANRYRCLATLPEHPEWAVWLWLDGDGTPFTAEISDLTPPPELPPAELAARLQMWVNVYPNGYAAAPYFSREAADEYCSPQRAWLVHPDGRWQKCNGKEVIGEPVEVPR